MADVNTLNPESRNGHISGETFEKFWEGLQEIKKSSKRQPCR